MANHSPGCNHGDLAKDFAQAALDCPFNETTDREFLKKVEWVLDSIWIAPKFALLPLEVLDMCFQLLNGGKLSDAQPAMVEEALEYGDCIWLMSVVSETTSFVRAASEMSVKAQFGHVSAYSYIFPSYV